LRCQGAAWAERAAAAFNAAHAASGVWPAAVLVRNATFPGRALDVLTRANVWDVLADRCGGDTSVAVHDLDAQRELHMPLAAWAALCRHRAAGAAPEVLPHAPPGVGKQHWAALLSGSHVLYLSAFEAQTHAPEVAAAFNALAGTACLLRHVPYTVENLGPIVMAADAGASSGWCGCGAPAVRSAKPDARVLAGTATERGCAARRFAAAT
jgi:hypothetical protein